LDSGFLLEKEITFGCPTRQENPRILVTNTPMDYDKIKIFGSRVKTDSMVKVAEIE
jgi:T-complex protein 1 subunit beta